MQPELFKPSHEARQTNSFKKYLPNLTAFKKSSRRWTTSFISKDLSKNLYAARTMQAFARIPPNTILSKSTSQIWRPSKNPADAGPQLLFAMIYLKIFMQPEICKPSHEAHQTSLFKTYLPNLTAFQTSSRRWTTGLILKDLSKKEYAARTM